MQHWEETDNLRVGSRYCRVRVAPFFMDVGFGERFCLLHKPVEEAVRGGLLYLHPFAEEMHKSRRMAAAQARRFAALGFAVLQIDLFGCGDSCGDLQEASIEIWRRDLQAAAAWMRTQGYVPLRLWALRFGALLAAEEGARAPAELDGILLWQPVISGSAHLTQFMRIATASEMLSGEGTGVKCRRLQGELAQGRSIEVAGYELGSGFAGGMERLHLERSAPLGLSIDWLEIALGNHLELSASSIRVIERWRSLGIEVRGYPVDGDPFWATAEIAESPELLDRTSRIAAELWT